MPSPALLATLYGICTAASWGTGDFSGGLASKRADYRGVVVVSQFIGVVLLAAIALLVHSSPPPSSHVLIGALGGVFGGFGLLALYRGLSIGPMGVVAPVAALVTAIIPVLFAGGRDGFPPAAKLVGFAFAFSAVWLLSGGGGAGRVPWRKLRLPLAAGMCFGSMLICVDLATKVSLFWPLVAARMSSGLVIMTVMLILRAPVGVPARWGILAPVALAGLCDATGNVFFVLAARQGRLDLASVVAALYPAFTVLLAWIVLKERLKPGQWCGVALALVALLLIAS